MKNQPYDYTDAFNKVANYFEQHHYSHHYLVKYLNYIRQRSIVTAGRDLPKGTYNDHHILPRNWGGTNDESNMIRLTHREHIIAHHILYHTKDPAMIAAYYSMANIGIDQDRYNLTSLQYEQLQLDMYPVKCANSKKNMSNPEIRAKISKSLKGRFTGGNHPNARAVINTVTGEIFPSAKQANVAYKYSYDHVVVSIHQKYNDGPNHWEYYDEYVANGCNPTYGYTKRPGNFTGHTHSDQTKKQIGESIKATRRLIRRNERYVLNETTGQVFDNAVEASLSMGYSRTTLSSALYKAKKQGDQSAKVGGYYWRYISSKEGE